MDDDSDDCMQHLGHIDQAAALDNGGNAAAGQDLFGLDGFELDEEDQFFNDLPPIV